MSLVIDATHCGPPRSGNGGWTAGELAQFVTTDADHPAVRVRLSSPPPLEVAMDIEVTDAGTLLRDGSTLIATAVAAPALGLSLPDVVSPALAAEAETRYEALSDHPFPTCFSCGTDRDPADALCLRPGPLGDGTGRYAARWTPSASSPSLVWAALDCPGGWSAGIAGRPMVLGEMTTEIFDLPVAGVEHVILAWQTGAQGRKHHSASALYAPDGQVLAAATATWITVDPSAIAPKESA